MNARSAVSEVKLPREENRGRFQHVVDLTQRTVLRPQPAHLITLHRRHPIARPASTSCWLTSGAPTPVTPPTTPRPGPALPSPRSTRCGAQSVTRRNARLRSSGSALHGIRAILSITHKGAAEKSARFTATPTTSPDKRRFAQSPWPGVTVEVTSEPMMRRAVAGRVSTNPGDAAHPQSDCPDYGFVTTDQSVCRWGPGSVSASWFRSMVAALGCVARRLVVEGVVERGGIRGPD